MFSLKRHAKAPDDDGGFLPDDDDGLLDDSSDRMGGRPGYLPPPKPPVGSRPFILGLIVLVLGSGLGTGVYLLSQYDLRDVIGLLDVADTSPRLAMEMPGRDGEAAPAHPGDGLLTPPGGGEPDPAVPPKPVSEAAVPPSTPSTPAAGGVAAPANVPPAAAVAASIPASTVPLLPSAPRAGEQPPSFEALPVIPKAAGKPLAAAPLLDLVRQTQAGPVPVTASDGRQAWKVYARPSEVPAGRPKVAVVVVGLGLDKVATEAAITRLPPEVTLAFSPYAGQLDKWAKKARDAGHEVLMDLPMEPTGFPARDPGPLALLTTLSPEDNLARLETVLAKGVGYTGVIASGDRYAASPQLASILGSLKEHGLLYLGAGAAPGERMPPSAAVTAIVDQDPFHDAVEQRLAQVAAMARRDGRAVAVAAARPVTLERLIFWLTTVPGQGLAAVPASAVVQQPAPAGKS